MNTVLAIAVPVLAVAIYVWMALALSSVFAKAAVAPWKAWVPILNQMELFKLGHVRPGWVIANLWVQIISGIVVLVATDTGSGFFVVVAGVVGAACVGFFGICTGNGAEASVASMGVRSAMRSSSSLPRICCTKAATLT